MNRHAFGAGRAAIGAIEQVHDTEQPVGTQRPLTTPLGTRLGQATPPLNRERHSSAPAMARGDLAAAVHHYLDGDLAAREMLARGVIGLRAMARWLIEDQGWTGITEDAVVSALRRYPTSGSTGGAEAARKVLERSHVNTRSNITSLVLPKSLEAHRALHNVLNAVDPSRGELVRIIEGERSIKVIVDTAKLNAVRPAVQTFHITRLVPNLVEYSIVFADDTQRVPGILAIVFSSLAAHEISIVEVVAGSNDLLIFVDEKDSRLTFQVLQNLTRKPRRA